MTQPLGSIPGPSVPMSDRALVEDVRTGDEDAARELYDRYASQVRKLANDYRCTRFASRFDADDVVQSVFRVLFSGIRSRHFETPEGGELWGLLVVLTANKLRDRIAYHRAAKRDVFRTTADSALVETPAAEGQTDALLKMIVDEFLQGLPSPDREVVSLRMAGHSVGDIASHTGRAIRTVERVLQRARDTLADIYPG